MVNIYALNIGAPQYIRQTLTDIKGEFDSNLFPISLEQLLPICHLSRFLDTLHQLKDHLASCFDHFSYVACLLLTHH